MKKIIFLATISMMFILAACSSTSSSSDTTSTVSGNPDPTTSEMPMSPEIQLIIGTFKLENTELAVNAEMAAQLLPLWQVLRDISDSDTASTVEIDALITQIRETMDPAQIEAIDALQITREDMLALSEELGLAQGFGSGRPEVVGTPNAEFQGEGAINPGGDSSNGSEDSSGSAPNMSPGRGPGGGNSGSGPNRPSGGSTSGGDTEVQDPGFMTGMDPSQIATAQASGAGSIGVNNQLSLAFMEALIELLQSKIQP